MRLYEVNQAIQSAFDRLDFDPETGEIFSGSVAQPVKADDSPMKKLMALMAKSEVSEAEFQKVVADKDPIETPIAEYDGKFITGWIIKYWDQIMPLITANRNNNEEKPQGFNSD